MMAEPTNTDRLQRQNRALSILNTIAEALNRSVDLDQALQTALAKVAELLDLQTSWIWLLHEDSGESYLAAAQNLPPALANNPERMEGSCYCLNTFRTGDLEGAANINVVTCSRLQNLVDGTDGLRYHASIPLYVHGKHLGVLNVASTDWRELSADDLQLLYTVGDLLSIAVERARLYAHSTDFGAAQERNRLAREIHDTLAQGLAAITMQLETAEALLESDDQAKRAQEAVHQALLLTRANLEEARRSVLDLRAAPLEGRSLPEALRTLVENLNKTETMNVELVVVGGQPLPTRLETGLYRITQEALSNIVQHANAQQARIRLTALPNKVKLLVEDDGQGFDTFRIPEGRFGLVGLNERAKLLGGKLHLESDPGSGTRLQVVIPMKSYENKPDDR